MLKKNILLTLIPALVVIQVRAQDVFQRFSSESGNYPQELSLFMDEQTSEDKISETQIFIQNWVTGLLTDTLKIPSYTSMHRKFYSL